jgi:hypothetical protein
MRRRRTFCGIPASKRRHRSLASAASLARQARVCMRPADLTMLCKHRRSFWPWSCVLEAVSALVDSLTSCPSHCPPRALLTICRSFLRGSIRCLAIASPVAPSARVAISTQHFSPAPMCSHCTPIARRKPTAATQTPPVAFDSTAAAPTNRDRSVAAATCVRTTFPGPWNRQSRF